MAGKEIDYKEEAYKNLRKVEYAERQTMYAIRELIDNPNMPEVDLITTIRKMVIAHTGEARTEA